MSASITGPAEPSRHVDAINVVLETDSGAVRELPASYVADHVEHAYCLTGHGMQGGTVERAVVVASPQDLTAGWSYSALSRARGATRLLIADTDRHQAERAEHAPDDAQPDQSRSAVMARAARRMLVRDDEDLAIEQLPAAGHEDDRVLAAHRAAVSPVSQEDPAGRAEPIEPAPSLKRLTELRERISRLQLTLGALPTKPLQRIDELDARARDLAARRSDHQEQLARLEPPARRFGRVRDPDAEARQFLHNAIEMDDRALADLAADRARLQRELGDPEQVRSERDSIENAIQQAASRPRPPARRSGRRDDRAPARMADRRLGSTARERSGSARRGIVRRARSPAIGLTTMLPAPTTRSVPSHRIPTSTAENGIRRPRRSSGRSGSSASSALQRDRGIDLGIG